MASYCKNCGSELQGTGMTCPRFCHLNGIEVPTCANCDRLMSRGEGRLCQDCSPTTPQGAQEAAPAGLNCRVGGHYWRDEQEPPGESCRADSYARLVEENKELRRLLRPALSVASCLRHGQLKWAVEHGVRLDERICEVEDWEEKKREFGMMTREEVESLLIKHRDASPMKQKYYCHLIDLMTTIPLHAKCETASVIAGLLEENEKLAGKLAKLEEPK